MGGSDRGRAGWVFGPVPDLLFGCGGLYVCVLLSFVLGGSGLREAEAVWLGPLLVLIVGAPHYGATILRVYEHRADRRAYVLFALHATLAIAAAFFGWQNLARTANETAVLRIPGEQTPRQLHAEPVEGASELSFRFADTGRAGVYQLTLREQSEQRTEQDESSLHHVT